MAFYQGYGTHVFGPYSTKADAVTAAWQYSGRHDVLKFEVLEVKVSD